MSIWDPTLMRVGASISPTSENRNSISSARPLDVMFARHSIKFGLSKPKLTSMCQPVSPGSACEGKRIGNEPRLSRVSHRPGPTSWSNAL
jgi:hypothetical protein